MRRQGPDPIQLRPVHRFLLYAVVALLFFSGAVWAWWNYFLVSSDRVMTAEAWAMKIHGAAAMAILVFIGTLLSGHVKAAWRAGRNRGNGALFLGVFGILTVTGNALYYAGGEKLRTWTSWIHLAVGLALPILLVIHVLLGKKSRPLRKVPAIHR